MGDTAELADLDGTRARGATPDRVADAFATGMLRQVGYHGPATGTADALRHLAQMFSA